MLAKMIDSDKKPDYLLVSVFFVALTVLAITPLMSFLGWFGSVKWSVVAILGAVIIFISFQRCVLDTAFMLASWFFLVVMSIYTLSWKGVIPLEPIFSGFLEGLIFFFFVLIFSLVGWETRRLKSRLETKSQQLHEALRMVRHLTIRDEQTGLYTFQYLKDILQEQKAHADRGEYRFVVADIKINDWVNHQQNYPVEAVATIINFVAQQLQAHVRNLDYCGRHDEYRFLMILTKTSAENARLVLERIVDQIFQKSLLELSVVEEVKLRVGITEYACTEMIENTLRRANAALDQAVEDQQSVCVLLSSKRQVSLVKDSKHEFNPINFGSN